MAQQPYGVEMPELLDMTKEDMGNWISKFVIEARKLDGNDYTGETLYQMVCGVQNKLSWRWLGIDQLMVYVRIRKL